MSRHLIIKFQVLDVATGVEVCHGDTNDPKVELADLILGFIVLNDAMKKREDKLTER